MLKADAIGVPIRPIVCDWDASSRRSGTSDNAAIWKSVLSGIDVLESAIVLNRRLGELIPSALVSVTSEVLDAGERPLMLGGDHRLSYSSLMAIAHRLGPGTVEHFDAHHDAHSMPTLSNFSVFDFASRRLGVNVSRHGCREKVQVPVAELKPVRNHIYISIDVDYLDPLEFASVSFPEPVPEGMMPTADALCAQLEAIGSRAVREGTPIVGADLVEWRAPDATDGELDIVVGVLNQLARILSWTRIAPVNEDEDK